jgi:hypothetical protein
MWRVNKMVDTRKATNKLLELIDDGMVSAKDVVTMCLKWMSEDDVEEMCEANEIFLDEDTDE